MRIWIDADNCPAAVRGIVIRASERLKVAARFVANRPLSIPRSRFLRFDLVGVEKGAADEYIKASAEEGDLVVTPDIPLTSELVNRGVLVIHPRGDLYRAENIGPRL